MNVSLYMLADGEIGSFDSLMRVLRMLGKLEILYPLIKEEEMSPNEYLEFVELHRRKQRKRATAKGKTNNIIKPKESEW